MITQQQNATERGTMQQTISQAAQLYGKARSTIHRAIESGRLSCSVRGDGLRVIDLAELIRLWGEPLHSPPQEQQNATLHDPPEQQMLVAELRALRDEVRCLREEMQELRRLPPPTTVEEPKITTEPALQAKVKTEYQAPKDFSDLLERYEKRTRN